MAGMIRNPAYEADELYADTEEMFGLEYFDVSPEADNELAVKPVEKAVAQERSVEDLVTSAHSFESSFSANPLYGSVLPTRDTDQEFILQTLASQQKQLVRLQWLVLGLVLTSIAIGVLLLT
jgi:hypothetical protein